MLPQISPNFHKFVMNILSDIWSKNISDEISGIFGSKDTKNSGIKINDQVYLIAKQCYLFFFFTNVIIL